MTAIPVEIQLILVVVLGLMVGSFLNVCVHRIPRKMSIVRPGSHCPNCNHNIKAWENIPVLSYLILRGRCSACHERISIRYLIVEAVTALTFVIFFVQFGWSVDFVIFTVFACLVLAVTFIDIERQVIPNGLLLFGLIPAVVLLIRSGLVHTPSYLLGAAGLGLGFYLLRVLGKLLFRKESMGMGDIKYAALVGFLLGWEKGLVAVSVAFLSAAVLFVLLVPLGLVSFGQRVPFGPFISFGSLFAIAWGQDSIDWYLRVFF